MSYLRKGIAVFCGQKSLLLCNFSDLTWFLILCAGFLFFSFKERDFRVREEEEEKDKKMKQVESRKREREVLKTRREIGTMKNLIHYQ